MKCYIHGFFHSMNDHKDVYHVMATQEGKIKSFDNDVDLTLCDEIIDLKGGHLYPGFVDAHLHMMGYGEYLDMIHLSSCQTKDEVIAKLLAAKSQDMIFAIGYLDVGITKHDLDTYFLDQVVILRHNDFHALTLNSKALSHFNIQDETGILKESKASYIMQNIPKPSFSKLHTMLTKSIESLTSFGLTGGHTDDLFYYNGFKETYQAFHEVLEHHPFRSHLLIHHEVLDDFIQSDQPWGIQNNYLELGAIKMFYDGTMSSKTALMYHPYQGEKTHGEVVMGYAQFTDVLKKVRSFGLSAAIHVIGDKGLEDVVDLLTKYPPKEGLIDRIIHAPWADQKTIEKMKSLPCSLDIQPQFLSSDLPRAFHFFSVKPDYVFPWKTYLDEKIIISGSSDAPVEIPNPFLGMKDAIFRRSNQDHKTYETQEALSHFEAIKLYATYAHAQSSLQPRGYLKPGYLADFTVCDRDIETLKEEEFHDINVIMTIIDDHIVYKLTR
ncbi:MAG: amidohydrolase [Acholeplasmataceae bacterium]|nr:amidohydrolase [Acholeplasmataceae bacterium]